MVREPRRPRVGAHVRAAPHRRVVGGLERRERRSGRARGARRHRPAIGADVGARLRGVLPRLLQRDLWPLYHDAVRRPRSTASWWRAYRGGEPALRRGRARLPLAGRERLGARLPAPARAPDAPRAAARRAHRLLPAHAVPSEGALHAAALATRDPARGCSARIWSASRSPAPRRTSRGSRDGSWARGQGGRPVDGTADGAGGRLPDLRRRARSSRPGPRAAAIRQRASRDAPRARRSRRSCSSGSTGSTTRRASSSASVRSPSSTRRGALAARSSRWSRSPSRAREADAHYRDERRHLEQIVGEVNGEHAVVGAPVIHYLHQSLDHRRAGRDVPRG